MVNSFRSELARKKAIFDLLTDDNITSGFPAAEKKAIRDFIPWTRVVAATKATYKDQTVDLPEFIVTNRERLALKPNDDAADLPRFHGSEMDQSAWERAVRSALRNSYVVQEVQPPATAVFPMRRWGTVEMREMRIDVQPHVSLGKVNGCSTWVTPAGATGGFSSLSGFAPTFILESR
jgi:hypothetical protein